MVLQPTEPTILSGFYRLEPGVRLGLVTRLESDHTLPPDAVRFLRSALTHRELDATTRNNIATILVNQYRHDPDLSAWFMSMVRDPQESITWKEYALQYAAHAVDYAKDPTAILASLWNISETGDESLPGTAILILHRLDMEGTQAISESALNDRMVSILTDPRSTTATRVTVLGIICERHVAEARPTINALLDDPTLAPAVRRTALAALGSVGTDDDRERLQVAMRSNDEGVRSAAKAAFQRLGRSSSNDTPSDNHGP